MTFVSHAQNFEDVILWRALKHVDKGVYVDVGAQDPVVDSVSLAFYERGWRGVHVEASPDYAAALAAARPGDTVISAAVGAEEGSLEFFEFPDTGLGTGDPGIARAHEVEGRRVRRVEVPCIPLDEVLAPIADGDIHWLKVDVEGMEASVLSSWRSAVRPWVVVVEATEVNSPVSRHDVWEPAQLDRGYAFVYFDGLNRYYVSEEHPELKAAFGAGPNVFDDFVLTGRSQFAAGLNGTIAALRADLAERDRTLGQLRRNLAASEARQEAEALAEATLGQLRRNLAASEARAQEAEALAEAYRTSTSWRFTAPLRTAVQGASHARAGARAWSRMATGSRPHRVALAAAARAEALVRSDPRLAAAARGLAHRFPALRARIDRVRAAALARAAAGTVGEAPFVAAEHPLRDRLVALLEAEIARERER